jgi:hypothetical protein
LRVEALGLGLLGDLGEFLAVGLGVEADFGFFGGGFGGVGEGGFGLGEEAGGIGLDALPAFRGEGGLRFRYGSGSGCRSGIRRWEAGVCEWRGGGEL